MTRDPGLTEVEKTGGGLRRRYQTALPGSSNRSSGGPAESDVDDGRNLDLETAEGCRAKAAALCAVAGQLSNPTYRARAFAMANKWAALADEYDAVGAAAPGAEPKD
jgi:hypothetical protein